MKYDVSRTDENYGFVVTGCSYIGNPRNNTILFITAKVKGLIKNLAQCEECLVYVENGIEIPEELKQKNCFVIAEDAQLEYAKLAVKIREEEGEEAGQRKYTLTKEGYFIGENVKLGKNCVIEPNCRIGHDVTIGDNSFIGFGSTIYNSVIGNDFTCLDYSVIGVDAFFLAECEKKFRIPSFGNVIINDNVDISSHVIIERGFNSDTIIDDNVKIDSDVVIGHDVNIGKNVVITSGTNVAGLVNIGDNTYIGMNSTIKQRLNIGSDSMIGMGSVVINRVRDEQSVFGNPARKYGI